MSSAPVRRIFLLTTLFTTLFARDIFYEQRMETGEADYHDLPETGVSTMIFNHPAGLLKSQNFTLPQQQLSADIYHHNGFLFPRLLGNYQPPPQPTPVNSTNQLQQQQRLVVQPVQSPHQDYHLQPPRTPENRLTYTEDLQTETPTPKPRSKKMRKTTTTTTTTTTTSAPDDEEEEEEECECEVPCDEEEEETTEIYTTNKPRRIPQTERLVRRRTTPVRKSYRKTTTTESPETEETATGCLCGCACDGSQE